MWLSRVESALAVNAPRHQLSYGFVTFADFLLIYVGFALICCTPALPESKAVLANRLQRHS